MISDALPLVIDNNGVIHVGTTRVTLEVVAYWYNAGASAEEIASYYPVLDISDVYYAIGYYLHNRRESEQYLVGRTRAAEQAREANERRFPNSGLKERLLQRRPA